MVYKVTTGP